MITRIKDDQYLNIFEHSWLVTTAEFIIAMNFLKIYDIETDTWHPRRAIWTFIAMTMLSLFLLGGLVAMMAAIKYLL